MNRTKAERWWTAAALVGVPLAVVGWLIGKEIAAIPARSGFGVWKALLLLGLVYGGATLLALTAVVLLVIDRRTRAAQVFVVAAALAVSAGVGWAMGTPPLYQASSSPRGPA